MSGVKDHRDNRNRDFIRFLARAGKAGAAASPRARNPVIGGFVPGPGQGIRAGVDGGCPALAGMRSLLQGGGPGSYAGIYPRSPLRRL